MGRHDFGRLREHYRVVIGMMNDEFNSHEFILRLAQYDQPGYVDALSTYCDGDEPFKIVHQQLSALLDEFPDLVEGNGRDDHSYDIFGNPNSCRRWRKIPVR